MQYDRYKNVVDILSIVIAGSLLIASFCCPVFAGKGGFFEDEPPAIGLDLLLRGWRYWPVNVIWMANPLLVLALIDSFRGHRWRAFALQFAATILALGPLCLVAYSWNFDDIRLNPPRLIFAGGRLIFEVGYLLWLCCHIVVLAITLVNNIAIQFLRTLVSP